MCALSQLGQLGASGMDYRLSSSPVPTGRPFLHVYVAIFGGLRRAVSADCGMDGVRLVMMLCLTLYRIWCQRRFRQLALLACGTWAPSPLLCGLRMGIIALVRRLPPRRPFDEIGAVQRSFAFPAKVGVPSGP